MEAWKKNIIFGADTSSSVHDNNKNKKIFILGKGETKGLNNPLLTAEAEYSINIIQQKFILSLHYNESDSFLFVNATKIYQLKKKSEIKQYPSCLGNTSKDFTFKIWKKQD